MPTVALVTGATGFIGSHLVEHLLARGYRVRCLVRNTSNVQYLRGLDVERVDADLRSPATLAHGLDDIDVLFHVAGVTAARNAKDFFDGNARATANLVAACANSASRLRRFVYVSSLAAAGPAPAARPVTEDVSPRPVSTYGRSKLAGETIVRSIAQRIPMTIIRPPVVYGPRDRDVYQFFRMAKAGVILHVGHRRRSVSLIHVTDLVEGLIAAAESPNAAGKCYYLANERPYDRRDVAEEIALAMDKPPPRHIPLPEPLWYAAGFLAELVAPLLRQRSILSRGKIWEAVQDYWTCDPANASRDFGWRARIALPDGLRRTAEWYRAQGWL